VLPCEVTTLLQTLPFPHLLIAIWHGSRCKEKQHYNSQTAMPLMKGNGISHPGESKLDFAIRITAGFSLDHVPPLHVIAAAANQAYMNETVVSVDRLFAMISGMPELLHIGCHDRGTRYDAHPNDEGMIKWCLEFLTYEGALNPGEGDAADDRRGKGDHSVVDFTFLKCVLHPKKLKIFKDDPAESPDGCWMPVSEELIQEHIESCDKMLLFGNRDARTCPKCLDPIQFWLTGPGGSTRPVCIRCPTCGNVPEEEDSEEVDPNPNPFPLVIY
jgi:hypothetical protein